MAEAKKCDKCGKFYEDNKRYHGIINTGNFVNGLTLSVINGIDDKHFDLCDDCVGQVLTLLNVEDIDPVELKQD